MIRRPCCLPVPCSCETLWSPSSRFTLAPRNEKKPLLRVSHTCLSWNFCNSTPNKNISMHLYLCFSKSCLISNIPVSYAKLVYIYISININFMSNLHEAKRTVYPFLQSWSQNNNISTAFTVLQSLRKIKRKVCNLKLSRMCFASIYMQ